MAVKIKTQVIDNYRKENNLTVKLFCEKCGISSQSYYKFIDGNLNMRLSVLLKIIKTMKILCADIFDIDY